MAHRALPSVVALAGALVLLLFPATLAGCGQGSKRDTRALLVAAEEGNMLALKEALENGSAPDDVLNVGDRTALLLAAMHGHSDVVAYLLERGADPNYESEGARVKLAFRSFAALMKNLSEQPEMKGTYRKQDGSVVDIRSLPYRPYEYEKIQKMLDDATAKADAPK